MRLVTYVTIGETTGLIAVASDTHTPMADNINGNVHWEFLHDMKALATVGEVDKDHGYPLTGWPDGNAAWLVDDGVLFLTLTKRAAGTWWAGLTR